MLFENSQQPKLGLQKSILYTTSQPRSPHSASSVYDTVSMALRVKARDGKRNVALAHDVLSYDDLM